MSDTLARGKGFDPKGKSIGRRASGPWREASPTSVSYQFFCGDSAKTPPSGVEKVPTLRCVGQFIKKQLACPIDRNREKNEPNRSPQSLQNLF